VKNIHEKYGVACLVYARLRSNVRTLLEFHSAIVPAILHEQIMFVFDKSGEPIAYWTWAFLSREVESSVISDYNFTLHEGDWNESNSLWIMELVAPCGYINDIVYYIRCMFSNTHDTINVRKPLRKTSSTTRFSQWSSLPGKSYHQWCKGGKRLHLHESAFAASHSEWRNNIKKPVITF
jgi:hemolysin-activating ACP:hemolysin acyltransferase